MGLQTCLQMIGATTLRNISPKGLGVPELLPALVMCSPGTRVTPGTRVASAKL